MSKIDELAIIELNNIMIRDIEDEGFIIDITKIGKSKTTTSWKIDMLFNTLQVVLTFYKIEEKEDLKYRIEIIFSEAVLTKSDIDSILRFLIKNIK